MSELITFQSFYSEEEALEISKKFSENDIESKIEKTRYLLDRNFIGDNLEPKIFLKIKSEDFKKANELLNSEIEKNLAAIEPDYYLYSFSTEELIEIIKKPDEWSRQDFLIAKMILTDRGEAISEGMIDELKADRISELGSPEKESGSWIALGYFLTLFVIPGLIFGIAIKSAKKILPDGQKVNVYDKASRSHAQNIIVLSLIFLVLAMLGNKTLLFYLRNITDYLL